MASIFEVSQTDKLINLQTFMYNPLYNQNLSALLGSYITATMNNLAICNDFFKTVVQFPCVNQNSQVSKFLIKNDFVTGSNTKSQSERGINSRGMKQLMLFYCSIVIIYLSFLE